MQFISSSVYSIQKTQKIGPETGEGGAFLSQLPNTGLSKKRRLGCVNLPLSRGEFTQPMRGLLDNPVKYSTPGEQNLDRFGGSIFGFMGP